METLVPILTATFICAVGLALYMEHRRGVVARDRELARRMRHQVGPRLAVTETLSRQLRERIPQTPRPARLGDDLMREIDRWLAQGGIDIPAARFLALMAALGVGGSVLTGLWVGARAGLLYGLLLMALPVGHVYLQRERRLTTFGQQLPYVLDFLRSAISAGHTLLRGVQMATENSPEPIATELRLVVEQIKLGASLPDALDSMFRRVPEESLGFLVAAVRVQAEVGSGISEILDRVTDSIRARMRLQQEIKSLTAQARMSGYVVGALPFALLALFTIIRPGYTYPLFHDPKGIKMLEAATLLDVVALIVIRQMVKID
jgi:tight adherence protein B